MSAAAASNKQPTSTSLSQEIATASQLLYLESKAITEKFDARIAYLKKLAVENEATYKKQMIKHFFLYANAFGKYKERIKLPKKHYSWPDKQRICDLPENGLVLSEFRWFELQLSHSEDTAAWALPVLGDGGDWACSVWTWFRDELAKHFTVTDTDALWHESRIKKSCLKAVGDPA